MTVAIPNSLLGTPTSTAGVGWGMFHLTGSVMVLPTAVDLAFLVNRTLNIVLGITVAKYDIKCSPCDIDLRKANDEILPKEI